MAAAGTTIASSEAARAGRCLICVFCTFGVGKALAASAASSVHLILRENDPKARCKVASLQPGDDAARSHLARHPENLAQARPGGISSAR